MLNTDAGTLTLTQAHVKSLDQTVMEEKTQQTKTKFWKFQKQTYCENLIYLRVS